MSIVTSASESAFSSAISSAEIASIVFGLAAGRVSLLSGVEPHELRAILDRRETSPVSVLFADIPTRETAQALVEAALGVLADAALRMWPLWYASECFEEIDGSTLGRAALRIRLDGLCPRVAGLSTAWASAAIGEARRGRRPRVPGASAAAEALQLGLALGRPVLVTRWTGAAAEPWVAAIEWLARTAGVPVLVLREDLPPPTPPYDRWGRHHASAAELPTASSKVEVDTSAIWLSRANGRPHPFSDPEKKLAHRLAADRELGPLFGFNLTVRSRHGRCHKVDLLWADGKVIVEIDGYADHSTRPKFRDDRHRDYELLLAGYRVLRITNDEIADDCGRALEKIRDVVRAHRQGEV